MLDRTEHAGILVPVGSTTRAAVRNLCRVSNLLVAEHELRDLGYTGGYTILTEFLRDIRPAPVSEFEIRFETPPGRQARGDFAHFRTVFTDEAAMKLLFLVLNRSGKDWRMLPQEWAMHEGTVRDPIRSALHQSTGLISEPQIERTHRGG